jgi:leader peptidase (prepilin peptidase)/N-methyltransferase
VIELIASGLAGWLAGGVGNWAADALPRWRRASTPDASPAGQVREGGAPDSFSPFHSLTLPWYPFRKGICPHCGEKRPLRAPLLELGMMAVFLAGWQRFQPDPARLLAFGLFAWYLLVVLVIDLEHRLVLDVMTVPAAAAALLISFLPGGTTPLSALVGGAVGLGMFLLIALGGRLIKRGGAMGAGDVKLAGVIGLMTGFPAVLSALVLGILLGGVGALVLLVTRRAGRRGYMAYAPYLAAGALVVLWWGM